MRLTPTRAWVSRELSSFGALAGETKQGFTRGSGLVQGERSGLGPGGKWEPLLAWEERWLDTSVVPSLLLLKIPDLSGTHMRARAYGFLPPAIWTFTQ